MANESKKTIIANCEHAHRCNFWRREMCKDTKKNRIKECIIFTILSDIGDLKTKIKQEKENQKESREKIEKAIRDFIS